MPKIIFPETSCKLRQMQLYWGKKEQLLWEAQDENDNLISSASSY